MITHRVGEPLSGQYRQEFVERYPELLTFVNARATDQRVVVRASRATDDLFWSR